jgi:autotransporter adhesin
MPMSNVAETISKPGRAMLSLRGALVAFTTLSALAFAQPAMAQLWEFPPERDDMVDDPCRQSATEGGPGEAGIFGSELACGISSNASGVHATAIGVQSEASSEAAVAVGHQATASGEHSVAIGGPVNVFGEEIRTEAAGRDSIAIGAGAHANNGFSIAIGTLSTAAQGGVALGDRSFAAGSAIAIGEGVRAERANQVAIGGSASTYTLSGIASAESRTFQASTGPLFFVTSDATGNLATSELDMAAISALPGQVDQNTNNISGLALRADEQDDLISAQGAAITDLDNRVDGLQSGFDSLSGEISETRTEARQGIAAAIAMATAPMPSAPGKTSWASNLGFFKGESAFGGSVAHRFDTDNPFGLTAGYSYGGGDSHAARFGLMGEF